MSLGPWGVYVHVPWCRVQCPYCAFYVVTGEVPAAERFVARVRDEFEARAWPGSPATLYLGGGTPSQLPPPAIHGLVQAIGAQGEVTAEANPEDLSDAWLDGAISAGVNRISLGVQSLQGSVARRLGRGHTGPQARTAMARLAAAPLASWSTDLIFAVPGQTMADLDRDLDQLIDAGAPHVSLYGLTIEPDTPFARAQARGRLTEVADEQWHDMYEHIVARLTTAGLRRYEISNFAQPGHESEHNALYWTDRPYLGLGPGAHGFAPDGTRWHNRADLAAYLRGGPVARDVEHPSPRQAAGDLLVSGLRGVEGVSRSHLRKRTGLDVDPTTVQLLVDSELLVSSSDRISLGRRGFALADGVARRLLDTLIEPVPDSGGSGRSG